MTLNYPGPYEIRIHYDTTYGTLLLNHVHRLNIAPTADPDPAADWDTITIANGIGSTSDLETELLAWIALLADLYHTSSNFNYAELWKYTPGSFDAAFWGVYDISDTGNSASGTVEDRAAIYTFYTAEGGTMKVKLLESITTGQDPRAAAALSAAEAALVNYVIDPLTGNFWLGRDTSYPFAFRKMFPGEDEATFKRRHRIS